MTYRVNYSGEVTIAKEYLALGELALSQAIALVGSSSGFKDITLFDSTPNGVTITALGRADKNGNHSIYINASVSGGRFALPKMKITASAYSPPAAQVSIKLPQFTCYATNKPIGGTLELPRFTVLGGNG